MLRFVVWPAMFFFSETEPSQIQTAYIPQYIQMWHRSWFSDGQQFRAAQVRWCLSSSKQASKTVTNKAVIQVFHSHAWHFWGGWSEADGIFLPPWFWTWHVSSLFHSVRRFFQVLLPRAFRFLLPRRSWHLLFFFGYKSSWTWTLQVHCLIKENWLTQNLCLLQQLTHYIAELTLFFLEETGENDWYTTELW